MGGGKANYARIGFTVVAGIAAIAAALAYFGGVRGKGDEFLAETYYDSAVSGLSVGSEVNFRGVKIGEVKSISFIGADYLEASESDAAKIRVVMALNKRLMRPRPGSTPLDALKRMIRKGVRAMVSSSGITGLSRIELDYPALPRPKEKLSWKPAYLCIPPAPSMLESFADSATRIMNHINDMDLKSFCNDLTSAVSSASRAAEGAAGILEANAPAVSEMLSNLGEAARLIKEAAAEIRDEPSLLLRSRDREPLPETAR